MEKERQIFTRGTRRLIGKAFRLGVNPLRLEIEIQNAIRLAKASNRRRVTKEDLGTLKNELSLMQNLNE